MQIPNIKNFTWEHCKRPTGCRGCFKTMQKGDVRLKTEQPGYRYIEIRYYCKACGENVVENLHKVSKILNFDYPGSIPEPKRKRFLRPVEEK